MDVSTLDKNTIQSIAALHRQATVIFDGDPLEVSEKKQNKIRKWISNWTDRLPEDVVAFFENGSNQDVFLFLKSCHGADEKHHQEKIDRFERDFADFNEEIKAVLKYLLTECVYLEMSVCENNLRFLLDDTPAFQRVLWLKNVNGVPDELKTGFYSWNTELMYDTDQGRYVFCGEAEQDDESELPFAITFDDAQAEVCVYNACSALSFWDNAWNFLQMVGHAVQEKSKLPGEYCNAQEREMLPLIEEIVSLEYYIESESREPLSFKELKNLTQRYGYTKATRRLLKLETIAPCDPAFHTITKSLVQLLCKKSCEPLWREIHEHLATSQAAYPNKAEMVCPHEILDSLRADIQQQMLSHGYSGTYPHFEKIGQLKGLHLECSYDQPYFVCQENRMQSIIHCYEYFNENDGVTIQFLCGTAFLKKQESADDLYGCLFNANGRRLFHAVHHYVPLAPDTDEQPNDLTTSVNIAVKKAECTKLNKQEREQYFGTPSSDFEIFCWVFLIMGGFFSIAMNICMAIICVLITALFGVASEIPDMLCAMPWGWMLAIGWIGFGGGMGITNILARRK